MNSPTALVTGSAGGVGTATVRALLSAGFDVYAGVRRPGTAASMVAVGAHEIPLDVSREDSMSEAVRDIEQRSGAVDVLVNNAGYALAGPIEEIGLEPLRAQFEVNVFGVVRMSQL